MSEYEAEKHERADRIAAAAAQGWTGPWRFGNEHLHGTPPGGKRHVADGDHVPEGVDKIIVDLHHRMKCMAYGLSAVRGLIVCSNGVAGLHLNGEVAAWSELEGDGQFAEWLEPFNHAEDVMRRM